jgi:hypothetical protein
MNPNNKTDSYIPALAKTALDMPPLWGRLISVSPEEAEFLSHFEIPQGRVLALSFDLGRASFEDVRARVKTALRDSDGYYNYVLVFLDETQRGLLKAAIS